MSALLLLALASASPDAWSATLAALERGDFRAAHVAAHASDDPDALRARGELWLRAGDDGRAFAAAEAGLAHVPMDPLLLLQNATAALRLGRSDAHERVERFALGVEAAALPGDEQGWWSGRLSSRRDEAAALVRRHSARAGAERRGRSVAFGFVLAALVALVLLALLPLRADRTGPSRTPAR